ncbi:hypothetical protein SAMN05428964_105312 [Thalassospira xiamenensis]|uniref:Secreted protein n=1 Tax=Thalassospira xiamenensis TaxID=220697 RepID=A0A285TT57_9PROT|nr:hypothetical protein SAMN05428964_105312 [Thalassospira xiamenensis]
MRAISTFVALGFAVVVAQCPQQAYASDPFTPPSPEKSFDVDELKGVIRGVVLDVLLEQRSQDGAPVEEPSVMSGVAGDTSLTAQGGSEADVAGSEPPANEVERDRTVGATLLGCKGFVGMWREPEAGPASNSTTSSKTSVSTSPVKADPKFGVIFYAIPLAPVRNPCAE